MSKSLLNPLRKAYYRFLFIFTLGINYFYDFRRYLRFSATLAPYASKQRYQGRITANYHVIEKGLSLKNTRVGFGANVVSNLVSLLEKYQKQYGLDDVGQIALNTLLAYHQFNCDHDHDDPQLLARLTQLKSTIPDAASAIQAGGTRSVSKDEIKQSACVNFRDFVNSRHSIRNFSAEEVDLRVIEEAVAMALKTPSVCNRQTWKVYTFSDETTKNQVLSYQSGNRGFGDTANKVLIITTDLNYFIDAKERNQCFIDGGLFAMSLVYALHSLGVGTCCLNWSVTHETDRALKQTVNISPSESIIMMLAVGHLPEQFEVAFSARKPVEAVLIRK